MTLDDLRKATSTIKIGKKKTDPDWIKTMQSLDKAAEKRHRERGDERWLSGIKNGLIMGDPSWHVWTSDSSSGTYIHPYSNGHNQNRDQYEKDLAERQRQHLEGIRAGNDIHWRPCMHDACTTCHGTGRKVDGTMCIHCLSCPCPKCTPYC